MPVAVAKVETTTLSYLPRASGRHRWARRSGIAFVLLAAAVLLSAWTIRFAQQLIFLQQQKQLLDFSLPPNTIIASTRIADDGGLLNGPGYQMHNGGPLVSRTAPGLILMNPTPLMAWGHGESCAFIHRLRTPGKPWRLVSVPLSPTTPFTPNGQEGVVLTSFVQVPAGLNIASRLRAIGEFNAMSLVLPAAGRLRLYAGQPDATDDSHFTIGYEHDGQNDTIDGFLLPNDMVKLEIRQTKK